MAKQRYVQDSFWTDPYIEKLTPDEKLVFLHLLTNPQCNIAGVYELRAKRLAYETGYDVEVVENILKRFVRDKKLIRFNDWIVMVNHLKHQNLGDDTAKGVNRIISETPKELQALYIEKIITNTKGNDYSVLVLKEFDRPPIDPLYTPTNGAYSVVRNKVKDIVISKVKFGEFENVQLKEEEHQKLIEKLGEKNTNILIEELSGYLASTNKRYASHYATLLNWARRKIQNHQEKLQTKKRTII
jgi:hypothetical protein